jgi:hypothetical protein
MRQRSNHWPAGPCRGRVERRGHHCRPECGCAAVTHHVRKACGPAASSHGTVDLALHWPAVKYRLTDEGSPRQALRRGHEPELHSETGPGAGAAPASLKKGLRRSTFSVGLQRILFGRARVKALGLGQAVTVKGPSHRGRSLPMSAASSSFLVRGSTRAPTLYDPRPASPSVPPAQRPAVPSLSPPLSASAARIKDVGVSPAEISSRGGDSGGRG